MTDSSSTKVDHLAESTSPSLLSLAQLGAPDDITGSENRLIFEYQFKTTKFFRLDFGTVLRLWSPVTPPLSVGSGDAGTDTLLLAFDHKWVALDLKFPHPQSTKGVSFFPF